MNKTIRVVGCILRCENKILMLRRSDSEIDPLLWGIPAGKVEAKEDDLPAILREVYEETGITLKADSIHYLGELIIEYNSNITIIFPLFYTTFTNEPEVILDPTEHVEYVWLTVNQALALPNLMRDVDKILIDFCIDKLGMSKEY